MTIFVLPATKSGKDFSRRRTQTALMNGEQTELDGLQALNPEAISSIHNRYFPEVYRYSRYRLGDETLAEDIASEVFARLLEALNAGRGPKTSLRGWLLGTAANLVNDHLRHVYNRPSEALTEESEIHTAGPGPGQQIELTERNQAIRSALGKLTPEQQQVIALRFGGDYSLEETANLMNKNANAIKQLQFRALASLRRFIAEEIL